MVPLLPVIVGVVFAGVPLLAGYPRSAALTIGIVGLVAALPLSAISWWFDD